MASKDCWYVYNITDEQVSGWLYTPADTIIITIVVPILLGLGLITNSTFLLVIFRIPKMRSDTNVILTHLAVADLMFLITSAILYIWSYSVSILGFSVPYQTAVGCAIPPTVINTGYFASILLLTLASSEKYLAMCHPMKHLKIRGRRRTHRLVAVCWLVGLLISVSLIPGFAAFTTVCLQWPDDDMYTEFPTTFSYCYAVLPWVTNVLLPLLNFPWIIAMIANMYMFAAIVRALNKRMGADGRVDDDRKAQQVRNQVAKMLVVNGVIFFICHVPYRVLTFSRWICDIAQTPNPIYLALGRSWWLWVQNLPELINTVINPLIYGVMNSQYRKAFSQVFRCRLQQTNSAPTVSQTAISVVQESNSNYNDTRM